MWRAVSSFRLHCGARAHDDGRSHARLPRARRRPGPGVPSRRPRNPGRDLRRPRGPRRGAQADPAQPPRGRRLGSRGDVRARGLRRRPRGAPRSPRARRDRPVRPLRRRDHVDGLRRDLSGARAAARALRDVRSVLGRVAGGLRPFPGRARERSAVRRRRRGTPLAGREPAGRPGGARPARAPGAAAPVRPLRREGAGVPRAGSCGGRRLPRSRIDVLQRTGRADARPPPAAPADRGADARPDRRARPVGSGGRSGARVADPGRARRRHARGRPHALGRGARRVPQRHPRVLSDRRRAGAGPLRPSARTGPR